MNIARAATVTLGLAVGSAVAVAAYGAIAPTPTAAKPVLAAVAEPTPAPTTLVYDPCVAPAKLERGVCVTHKVQTVVVTTPAPLAVPAPRNSVAAAPKPVGARPAPKPTADPTAPPRDEDRDHADEDRDDEDRDHAEEDHGEDHEDHEDQEDHEDH